MDVVYALDVFRLNSFFVHQIAVVGDIVIDIFDLLDDLFVLDSENLLAGRGLDLFLVIVFHGGSFPWKKCLVIIRQLKSEMRRISDLRRPEALRALAAPEKELNLSR